VIPELNWSAYQANKKTWKPILFELAKLSSTAIVHRQARALLLEGRPVRHRRDPGGIVRNSRQLYHEVTLSPFDTPRGPYARRRKPPKPKKGTK
jgi:hypothetical protein